MPPLDPLLQRKLMLLKLFTRRLYILTICQQFALKYGEAIQAMIRWIQAAAVGQARVIVVAAVEGAAHALLEEAPEASARAVADFLAGVLL